MHDFIMTEDSEIWNIILDGPHVAMKKVKEGETTKIVPKIRKEYNETDRKRRSGRAIKQKSWWCAG